MLNLLIKSEVTRNVCQLSFFIGRKATILNLIGEKLDQQVVRDSLKAALSPWKDQVKLKHYSCAESSLDPVQKGKLVVFDEMFNFYGDQRSQRSTEVRKPCIHNILI